MISPRPRPQNIQLSVPFSALPDSKFPGELPYLMNICVKQSPSTDIKNSITWAKALTKENDFFSRTALWVDSSTCSDIIWLDLRMTSRCPSTRFQRSSEGVLDQEEIVQSVWLAQDRFKQHIWALWGPSLQFCPFEQNLSGTHILVHVSVWDKVHTRALHMRT